MFSGFCPLEPGALGAGFMLACLPLDGGAPFGENSLILVLLTIKDPGAVS